MPRKNKQQDKGLSDQTSEQRFEIKDSKTGITINTVGKTEKDAMLDANKQLKQKIMEQIETEKTRQVEAEGWWKHCITLLEKAQAFIDACAAGRSTDNFHSEWYSETYGFPLNLIGAGYGTTKTEARIFATESIAKKLSLLIKRLNPSQEYLIEIYQKEGQRIEGTLAKLREERENEIRIEQKRKEEQQEMCGNYAKMAEAIIDYEQAWRSCPLPPAEPANKGLPTALEIAKKTGP